MGASLYPHAGASAARELDTPMSRYTATIRWARDNKPFLDNRYSRAHEWQFDGGLTIPASSSPHVVPEPQSVAFNVDPEEAFVASVSSCHMLWFLSLAARKGFVVDSYDDDAVGVMEKNADGKVAITHVTLRPRVNCASGTAPSESDMLALHHMAHAKCYIANSVKTEIHIEPVW